MSVNRTGWGLRQLRRRRFTAVRTDYPGYRREVLFFGNIESRFPRITVATRAVPHGVIHIRAGGHEVLDQRPVAALSGVARYPSPPAPRLFFSASRSAPPVTYLPIVLIRAD